MHPKRTLIVAQILISCMMAFLMVGIFSFVEFGATQVWLENWISRFIVAWPIAFVLSIFVSNLSFRIAVKVTN